MLASATSFYVTPKAIEYGISGEGSQNPNSDQSEVKKLCFLTSEWLKCGSFFPKLVPYSIEFDVLLYENALARRRRKFWRFGRCKIAE